MENKKILESWKEIADYLNRTEKTCRRFEQELGLPVHRLEKTPKARVFAYKEEIDRWIKETQNSEKEVPIEKPFLKKLYIPAVIVIGIAIIALIIWQLFLQKEKKGLISKPQEKPSLAVLYFRNSTGDPSLDFWRSALAGSLILDLQQSKHMNVLSADRLFSILKKLNLLEAHSYATEELKKIASEGQTNYLLLGSFSRAGDIFRIEITLQDVNSEEVLDSERVEGTGEKSFFSMIDELTRRIKSSLDISPKLIANDIDRDIGQITTSSPEALKYFTEGFQYLFKGDLLNSISILEKALAVDPDFAMAYRTLGAVYSSIGNVDKNRVYTQKAMELSDRVSDREKYIIQGTYYSRSEKTLDKAIEAYHKLLELYPEDVYGNSNLPGLYLRIGKNDKAIELSAKARRHFPNSVIVYCNSAYNYFTQGLYKKAEEILKYYEKNNSENVSSIKLFLAFSYLFQNKYDLALAEIDKSISLEPSNQLRIGVKGDIYLFMGDFLQAEREYNKLLENKEPNQIGRARLGALCLLLGKIEDSNAQVKKGFELQKKLGRNSMTPDFNLQLAYRYLRAGNKKKALELCNGALNYAIDKQKQDWQLGALYFKGLTFIGMKKMDDTQRTADELKRIAKESLNEKDIRWYYHLMGLIELEKKSIANAVEYFEKAIFLLNFEGHWINDLHALFIEPLAAAYFQSGDLEKAREEYEKISSLTKGRLYYGDIYAKSFYMLGKIYEQQRDRGKAIEHYEKFLNLWKDADRDFPEVQDTKKKLGELKLQ